jgi:hypothetical protein
MDRVVTGTGFKRSVTGIDLNSVRDADGTILTASTEPSREAAETNFKAALVVSASSTDLGTLTFMVPRDYDKSVDKMRIRFLVNSGGTTNEPILDAAIYVKKPGTALSADIDPTASAAIPKTSATTGAAWREITVEDQGLEPGDAVCAVLSTGAHTTDSVVIYALEVVYIGDLAYFETDERDDWAR